MVATNSMATRSSLELMLDKLQQTEDRPTEAPPALPVRPVSRARLPRPRRPMQLDLQRRNCEGKNGASFIFESKRTQKEDFTHFQNMIELSENSTEIEEKGISKIQKCYRGHRVRCNYKEVRTGIIALQSFIRGENARRSCQYKRRSTLEAIILIQKQTRKYFERREHESAGIRDCVDQRDFDENIHERKSDDQTRVTYTLLVDLQRRVLRTEAKLREKNEENIALKIQLEDMEEKWGKYEERMKLKENEWQDQFTYIQESLAAAKNNRSQNHDNFTITAGTPNGRSLDIQMNSVYQEEDGNFSEVAYDEACLKFHPQEEVRRLTRRFKMWKKEYKSKLRDAQSTFRKIGNSETTKRQKSWWGRLSQ